MTLQDLTALSDARVGTTGVVERIDLPEEVSHYLAHLGFLPGTSVEVLRQAPAGDPRVYRIDGIEVHRAQPRVVVLEILERYLPDLLQPAARLDAVCGQAMAGRVK